MLLCCRLRPLDISFMKAVHHKVNIVPVIAKSDTLTQQECMQLKRKVSALDTVWTRNEKDSENIHFQCIMNIYIFNAVIISVKPIDVVEKLLL